MAEQYGMAVADKYWNRANQILEKYNLDSWTDRKMELQRSANDFNNYLSSGSYSVDNNKKYRDMATQAVADLDSQMKRYGTNSNEYKTLKEYKNYYQNALPTFDRLDVGANVQDYLSYDQDKGFTNWHSQDDYNTQKSYLDQQRQAVQTELDAIEDQTSVDYQNLKSWQDQLDMYANALEERNTWDKQFEDVNDYTAYEREFMGWKQTNVAKTRWLVQKGSVGNLVLKAQYHGAGTIDDVQPQFFDAIVCGGRFSVGPYKHRGAFGKGVKTAVGSDLQPKALQAGELGLIVDYFPQRP